MTARVLSISEQSDRDPYFRNALARAFADKAARQVSGPGVGVYSEHLWGGLCKDDYCTNAHEYYRERTQVDGDA